MDHFNGTDVTLNVILMKDGEPFIPDADSVKFTVFDHTGQPLAGLSNVPVATSPTTFSIPILVPAAQNTISGSRRFERRTVVVTATRAGTYHHQTTVYRLIPFLNHAVQPAQVRAFIGVQEKELPDEDVDLFAAYLMVEKDFTAAQLDEALASGTTREIAANECIKLRAVLEVLPSVKQRIAQSEQNGPIGFERVELKDMGEVERAARDRYSSAKLEALGQTEAAVTLILVTADADPITG